MKDEPCSEGSSDVVLFPVGQEPKRGFACAKVDGYQYLPFGVSVEVDSIGLPREWYFVLYRLAEHGG